MLGMFTSATATTTATVRQVHVMFVVFAQQTIRKI
jgi:hypothetical protein